MFELVLNNGTRLKISADHYLFSQDGFIIFYDMLNHAVAEFVLHNVVGVAKEDVIEDEEEYEY